MGEERSLSAHFLSTSEPLLRLVKTFFTFSLGLFGSQYKESVVGSHQELYLAKPLHGQLMRDIGNDYDHKLQWSWLCRGNLDKETEGFVMAAQEQAFATNIIKNRIHHLPSCITPSGRSRIA